MADRQVIADVLTWDTQRQVVPEEIQAIAIVHDIVWVKLTENRAIPLHVKTFRSIRRQQLELQTQSQDNPVSDSDVEVDSDESFPNPVYRVWQGITNIGTFHRSLVDNKWLANPVYGRDYARHNTSDEAVASIVDAWNRARIARFFEGLEAA